MTSYEMIRAVERILQQAHPSFALENKLTTDTILQYLYQYTLMFVRNTYLQADLIEDGTRANSKNIDAIKSLSVNKVLTPSKIDTFDKNTVRIELPDDYFLYIRSNSLLSSTYKSNKEDNEQTITPNKIVNESSIKLIQTTFYNHPIIRNPYVILNSDNDSDSYMNIIHDNYTTINKVLLFYYRKPKQFGTKHIEGTDMTDSCELPDNVHMEIVEGAASLILASKGAFLLKSNNKTEL